MLSGFLNESECRLPVARLVDGYYLFGTLKVYLKIMGGSLVAKSGGAYVGFAEFMKLKFDSEIAKIDDMQKKGEWDQEALI